MNDFLIKKVKYKGKVIDINLSTLHKLFLYEKNTGDFRWKERSIDDFESERACKIWNSRYAGNPAGTIVSDGLLAVSIFKSRFQVGRICWMMESGGIPEGFVIDHIGKKSDNRLCNLVCVTKSCSQKNTKIFKTNSSGVSGVYRGEHGWISQVRKGNSTMHLGVFSSIDKAKKARVKAEGDCGYKYTPLTTPN